MNTNRLSPLMQAGVEGGGPQTIAGQYITKTEEGFMFSPGEGMEPIPVQDPDNILEMTEDGFVMDNDYQVEEGESGLVVKGVAGGGESTPGMPAGPGAGMGMPEGGVGGPMQMHSPLQQEDPMIMDFRTWKNEIWNRENSYGPGLEIPDAQARPDYEEYVAMKNEEAETHSPAKIYEDGKRRKNYTY